MAAFKIAFEGSIDRAVAERLLAQVGATVDVAYDCNGKVRLWQRIPGFNAAAKVERWFVLVDLDNDADCAPRLLSVKSMRAEPGLCLRVAVRSIEAWILADRERIADLLKVSKSLVPSRPEAEANPKLTLVNLARRSTSRQIRDALVPRDPRLALTGPLYNAMLTRFVMKNWRPATAAKSSPSLRRALERLRAKNTARIFS